MYYYGGGYYYGGYGGPGGGNFGTGPYGGGNGGDFYGSPGAYVGGAYLGSYRGWLSGNDYSSSNPTGYTSPDDVGGPPAGAGPSTQPLDSSIESFTGSDDRQVSVTFNSRTSDGLTGNQLVTWNLSSSVTDISDNADFSSYNISATTNGHTTGDHVYGDAVDINVINGVHVSSSGQGYANAVQLEEAALIEGDVRYVEGPLGNYARSTPNGDWNVSPRIPGDQSHVHISIFPQH